MFNDRQLNQLIIDVLSSNSDLAAATLNPKKAQTLKKILDLTDKPFKAGNISQSEVLAVEEDLVRTGAVFEISKIEIS